MYDLVCEPAILLDMLQDRANLALQQNLLSLADFLEISDGSLLRFAEKVCFLAENHIFKCKVSVFLIKFAFFWEFFAFSSSFYGFPQ